MTNPPVKVLQKPPAAMKIRMASLNQQVAVLTKAKHKRAKVGNQGMFIICIGWFKLINILVTQNLEKRDYI